MSWMAIIAMLVQIFGPYIAKLFKKWLDKLFNRVAKTLPHPSTYSSTAAARVALIDAAIEETPIYRPIRRAILRMMRDSGDQPSADQIKELKALAKAA